MDSENSYKHCLCFYILNGYISDKYKEINDPFWIILYLVNIGWGNMTSNAMLKAVGYLEAKLNGGVDGC